MSSLSELAGLGAATEWVRDFLIALSKGRLTPFTFVERKVRAATRNEPWGPTGALCLHVLYVKVLQLFVLFCFFTARCAVTIAI